MAKTFQERLQKKTKTKSFIGREAELALFRELLQQDEPEYLILLVHGVGGVGKTWLLNQWEHEVREKKYASARVDEEQPSVERILKKFRDDFVKQGFTCEEFDKSYQKFRQLKSEAEKALYEWEEKREEGVAKTAGRVTGKSVVVLAKLFTPSREALEFLGGGEKVEQVFAEGFGYLRKWFKSKEDLEFLENPLLHLARHFIHDLNLIADKQRIVLFFDTYEYLAPFCDEWLCNVFLKEELSAQIMFVFAGRHAFSSCWLDYQPLTRQIPLEVFTDEEARTYLSSRGVTNPQTVEEILKTSGKLPVYLAMLTSQANGSAQESRQPTESVVERFLKWIPKGESEKRRAVIACAFPRFFNKDLVRLLLGESVQEGIVQDVFEWIHHLPFITSERKRGWIYHELVRTQILRYKYQESRQEYTEIHKQALAYYRQNSINESPEEKLYHLLHIDSEQGILFALAESFAAWINGKAWGEWEFEADTVIRQVEKEREQEGQYSWKWKEYRQHASQKTKKAEIILKTIAEDEGFSSTSRTGAYNNLGGLFANLDRYEEAEAAYRKAIKLNSENAYAYNNLGLLLVDLDRWKEAEVAYRAAIEVNPEYASAYTNLGTLLADLDRREEAEVAYHTAIELNQEETVAYRNLGSLLADLGRQEEAEAAYRKAIELNPIDATIYHNLGSLLADLGRQEEAEMAYCQAIELNPEYASAYTNLGVLFQNLGRQEEAETAYRKAIESNPEEAVAYNNLGILLQDLDLQEEAEAAHRTAIELNPEYATAHYNLGNLFTSLNRYEEAEAAYRTAIELNPKFTMAHYNLGLLVHYLGRREEAEAAYRTAIELNPEDATMYNNLGALLAQQTRLEEAEQAFRTAIELNPELTMVYYNLGNLLASLNQWEEAEVAYRTALDLNPEDATAYYNLGCLYALQKDVEHSIEHLRKAIDLDPENRALAQTDTDLDGIRKKPLFQSLLCEGHEIEEA